MQLKIHNVGILVHTSTTLLSNGFCIAAIAVNSAEFGEFMNSTDCDQIIGKSAFSASFSFLKHQNISIIKKVMSI